MLGHVLQQSIVYHVLCFWEMVSASNPSQRSRVIWSIKLHLRVESMKHMSKDSKGFRTFVLKKCHLTQVSFWTNSAQLPSHGIIASSKATSTPSQEHLPWWKGHTVRMTDIQRLSSTHNREFRHGDIANLAVQSSEVIVQQNVYWWQGRLFWYSSELL